MIELGARRIGEGQPTFIVAEAGSNHDGDLQQAHRLIDAAANAGADAVKFQLFRADYLYPPNVGMVETPAGVIDFFDFLQKASLPLDWLAPLKQHADERGLIFLASAFDEESAAALDRIGVVMHKIASPELTHLPLIRHMARTRKPLMLSTGMARMGDIEDALDAAQGADVILLHCVSAYPLPPQDCNLNVIPTLRRAFELPVGFSDHTEDAVSAPSATVALGGNVIEKHFTLDRALPGPDHPFALEPDDLKKMVQAIRSVEQFDDAQRAALLLRSEIVPLLGSLVKQPAPSERELADCDRRMILTIRNIEEGQVITADDVRILRAERNVPPGLLPKYWDVVVGARAAREIPAGRGLVWDDVIAR
ncbi:MAG TPA: N-acetylneuraminate synthase family protein [Anaerolineae bacterium]|nr:N-acetylneuraminate synthase family protein [Anaerolineae bacterium]